ncbi:septin-2 [Galendromus occidentalis]|uniref:Septin n=1 Tax=Galendromus occidentalis TaxID=34638 RepID=A0AAJ7SIR3_9ACAR|nr:septin-2 [Galendromus occidentalis]
MKMPSGEHRGEIGFATLPEQVHRKSVKKGFDFTLMVVGEAGLGKSTLINSLFLMDLYEERKQPSVDERVHRTVYIEKKTMEIEEKGVRLRLTVVDTPGFGDALNSDDSWRAIEKYIDEQFNQFFRDESGLNRKNIVDNRVHCCLYFIPPWGHGLRQLDIEFMRRLHKKVNIVPVIAKADTLSPKEAAELKKIIMKELESHEIRVYQLPECDEDEDEELKTTDRDLKESIPFAVVSSCQVVEVGGRKVRGRIYPWGVVEVENPKHSDFLKLRTFLIRIIMGLFSSHMQDLKEVTRDVHYENYRAEYIQTLRTCGKASAADIGVVPVIPDADRLLQEKEAELRKMQEMLAQMQAKLKDTSRSATPSGSTTPDPDSRSRRGSHDLLHA